ncbi:DUF975 family protein [Sedimentibacter sp.]|uniref:DUF975 family protein n=1 Tax=Sedimentibacter sp. TaxID=1960295 RepID=UPI0028B23224|nr:DUF975 family protein [Sedimentibacter sp.]
MWDRVELKSLAKQSLKGNYWQAFLIGLVLALVSGTGGGGSSGRAGDRTGEYIARNPDIVIIVFAILILALAFRLLLGYSLEIGARRYFVNLAQFKNIKGYFSFAFDGANYKGIIFTMLLRDIFLFLWTLLLVIPGIIKGYSYRMVPYILADNPNVGAENAITLSRKMMDGHKFNTFILDLSFLGWYLLGMLVFVVGIFFVYPYFYATEAQLYLALRKNALEAQYCTYEDLNLRREFNDFDDYYRDDYNRRDDF